MCVIKSDTKLGKLKPNLEFFNHNLNLNNSSTFYFTNHKSTVCTTNMF
jgi:hypothetical protein